jgi:hypothetical protein
MIYGEFQNRVSRQKHPYPGVIPRMNIEKSTEKAIARRYCRNTCGYKADHTGYKKLG